MIAYILTRATPRLRSYKLAKELGFGYRLVCDNLRQADALLSMGHKRRDIHVCEGKVPGPPTGAAFKRDYIARNVAETGKWMLWLDDNVQHLTGPEPKYSDDVLDLDDGQDWRRRFAHTLSPKEVHTYLDESIERAEAAGTIMVGFATEENYYFRGRKWQEFGYCRTQLVAYKNDDSGWMPTPDMMFEDMAKTVDVVARYGSVVVNRHMKPVKPMFEAGGIGTLDERKPHLVRNCKWLMEQYPGLLQYSKGRDYHVTFAKRSRNTVDKWRREHGYA